jgi:hypothetical protein
VELPSHRDEQDELVDDLEGLFESLCHIEHDYEISSRKRVEALLQLAIRLSTITQRYESLVN